MGVPWKAIAGVLVALPVLVCSGSGLAGLVIDADVEVEVEVEVAARPSAVLALLDDAQGLTTWWGVAMERYGEEHGSEMAMEVVHVQGTPAQGVGCQIDFLAGGTTMERWEILRVEDNAVVYDVDFQVMRVERTLTVTPSMKGSRVHWAETGRIDNPWMRLMAKGMDPTEQFVGAAEALGEAAR